VTYCRIRRAPHPQFKESIMSNRLSSPLFTWLRAVLMSLMVMAIAIPGINGGWWG